MRKLIIVLLVMVMFVGMVSAATIKLRRDSAADWTSADPTLAEGEVGVETDTDKMKIGDGSTAWSSLDYMFNSASITDNSVTNAKMADDAIGIVELSATGTASSATFLCGDNTWKAASGGLAANANETITGDWTFEGDITIGNLADDSITTSMIATDAVTMDAVDADGTFTSLTGAWRTTGVLQGAVGVTSDTAATVTLGATDCLGNLRINGDDDVIDYTLPTASAGLSVTIYSSYAKVVTIDVQNTSDRFQLDGELKTLGNAIDSPGSAAGEFICLVAINDSTWTVLGKSGTWVDGGAD